MANSEIVVGGCRIPVTHNVADNLAEIKKAINWAAENNVDIMSTPECALSGYMWRPANQKDPRVAEINNAIKELQRYSVEKRVDLILGTAWYNAKNEWTNLQAFIINGECKHTHRKVVLFEKESVYYVKGSGSAVFDYKGLKIAGMICNDFWASPAIFGGQSGDLLKGLHDQCVNVVFLSANVPKTPGPNNIFYNWHKNFIEMFSASNVWNTVVCDTSNNTDGTSYNGDSCVPCGVCDYATEWVMAPEKGTAYFKASFQPDLKIAK
jgi:predicted amidohydrolase